jgi:ABC-type molybdate transport system substrate-binding protein
VLKEIEPLFVQQTGFAFDFSWAARRPCRKIIRAETPPDVFFPATEDDMQLVVQKGLVTSRSSATARRALPQAVEEGVEPKRNSPPRRPAERRESPAAMAFSNS